MSRRISRCIIDDIRFVVRNLMLLIAVIVPFLIILILKFALIPFSSFILSATGFHLEAYCTIIAITLTSSIPLLYGSVYAFILLDENDKQIRLIISLTKEEKKHFLYLRSLISLVISFFSIWLLIVITDPVPEEGWLRAIYVSSLMAFQAPLLLLSVGSLSGFKTKGFALTLLFVIFLAAVPFGLIVHHPWNYFAFFSPFYWISWAWVTSVPLESLLYGAISMIITFCCIFILFWHSVRKNNNQFIT
jgi:hypothetical protein